MLEDHRISKSGLLMLDGSNSSNSGASTSRMKEERFLMYMVDKIMRTEMLSSGTGIMV